MIKNFTKSNKLYQRSLLSIPLGSQTFSKSAMNFPQGVSPLFFEKGKGAYVWDYDGNKYIDFLLGLLPISLGYQDKDIDNAIIKQLSNGIVFSLPSYLEIELSELLIKTIPSAEKVRFGKNGSDVTSAAIRLARAYTKRNKVAICGYHGWHDWYIGTTQRNLGVPQSVSDLSDVFKYNDIDSLKNLFKQNPSGYAAVIIEPLGLEKHKEGFLESVKELCNKHGTLLIFDEIISGFRANIGGAQKLLGITPDLSTFGKSMANGMPISALVGKSEIMDKISDIFFSGTFSGETLSIVSAIATIKKLKKHNAPSIFNTTGLYLKNNLNSLVHDLGIEKIINFDGPDWWPRLSIKNSNYNSQIEVNTFVRQELISRGLFMGGTFNFSLANCDSKIIDNTIAIYTETLEFISKKLSKQNISPLIKGDLIQPIFSVRGK